MEAQLTGRMLPFPQSSLVYFSPSGRAADMEHDMAVHGASPRLSSPSMAPSVRIVQMDPSTLHTGHLPSLTNVLRTLKRQESSLFNCLASCLSDADVVQQLVALYPSLPTYANLRCGLQGSVSLTSVHAACDDAPRQSLFATQVWALVCQAPPRHLLFQIN